jgi:hypothetical protein
MFILLRIGINSFEGLYYLIAKAQPLIALGQHVSHVTISSSSSMSMSMSISMNMMSSSSRRHRSRSSGSS